MVANLGGGGDGAAEGGELGEWRDGQGGARACPSSHGRWGEGGPHIQHLLGVAAGGWYAQVRGVLLVVAVGGPIGKQPNEGGQGLWRGPAISGSGPGRLRLWLRAAAKLESTHAAASWASRWTFSWESPAIVAVPAAARREAGGLGGDAGGHDMASGVAAAAAQSVAAYMAAEVATARSGAAAAAAWSRAAASAVPSVAAARARSAAAARGASAPAAAVSASGRPARRSLEPGGGRRSR